MVRLPSTCRRPWEILQHVLEVGILHVGLLPKLVFLSAGTCVVGPQGGLVVVPVEEFVAWMLLGLPCVAKLSLTLLEEVLQGLVNLLV